MDKPKRKSYEFYSNDEDRRNADLEYKRKYANKKWKCEICSAILALGNKLRHMKNKKHINFK